MDKGFDGFIVFRTTRLQNIGLDQKQAKEFYFFPFHSASYEKVHFVSDEEIDYYGLKKAS